MKTLSELTQEKIDTLVCPMHNKKPVMSLVEGEARFSFCCDEFRTKTMQELDDIYMEHVRQTAQAMRNNKDK